MSIPSHSTPKTVDLPPVDRRAQLEGFRDVLNRIQGRRPTQTTLFQWTGGPGIGKSTLVYLLAQECDERRFPKIRVVFTSEAQSNKARAYLNDPTVLIEDIVTELAGWADAAHLQAGIQSLRQAIADYRRQPLPAEAVVTYFRLVQDERLYDQAAWIEALRGVVASFISLIQGLDKPDQPGIPVTLFFDETDYADPLLLDWIEEWLVSPLSQFRHCVIVWTARRPWRWKRPEIRRRLKTDALDVFAPEEVRQQVAASNLEPDLVRDLFRKVHAVTGGHPYASRVVIGRLNEWALTPETFSAREGDLHAAIFEEVIEKYAFRSLETYDLKQAGRFLAMVRQFDTVMLREVLMACGGQTFEGWTQEDFGDLLLRLKKTQLVIWDKGYTLDPALRYIIREYLFEQDDKQVYLRANEAALRVYERWLGKAVDNRSQYIIEELYHLACLQRAGVAGEQPDRRLATRLQQFQSWIIDDQALQNALERLEAELERDRGLMELEQFVPGFSATGLAKQVHAFLVDSRARPATFKPETPGTA